MTPRQIHPPPESLLHAIAAVAHDRFRAAEREPAALARAVRRVSEAYTRVQGSPCDLQSDREALCARLHFFLPRDFPKVQAPLAELAAVSALPRPRVLRVLDLGAGLGTTGLSAATFALAQPGVERVVIDAVDRDAEALALCAELTARYARAAGLAVETRTRCAALTPALVSRLAPPYHLILLGFVLNELSETHADAVQNHHEWLARLAGLLADDGAMVVLEPALRASSRALQAVRSRFAAARGPLHVFAPCLHREACPLLERERDWCHEQLPLALPRATAQLASAAGLRTAELSFSYLTLHRLDRSIAELGAAHRAYRVVSGKLGSKGKIELHVCGPGALRRLQRLDRHASPHNRALDLAQRGTILELPTEPAHATQLAKVASDTRVRALQT